MAYKKTKQSGVYEVIKSNGAVTGYSVVFKNEYNKTKRETAQNPEGDGKARTVKEAAIYLLQRKEDIEFLRNALEDQHQENLIADKTIDQVAKRYFNSLADSKAKEWEAKRYENHISGFIIGRTQLGRLTSSKIKPEDITALQRYLEIKLAPKTVNICTDLLRTIIRYGLANDHCKKNPMRRYKPLQVDNIVEKIFTPEEVLSLLDKAILPYSDEKIEKEDLKYYEASYTKIRLQMFMRLMYYTAQRPTSLLRLQKKHISDKNIFIESIKKQRDNYIPISDKLRPFLNEWIKDLRPDDYLFHPEDKQGQPVTRKGIEEPLNRLFAPLNQGLDYRKDRKKWSSLYTLRHSAATQALKISGNSKLVQSMLNHSDPRVTARYAKLLDETKLEGFNAL